MSHGVPEYKLISCPYTVSEPSTSSTKENSISKVHSSTFNNNLISILFVGKLSSKKRPLDLIRAFQLIHSENSQLIIIGTGPQETMLKQYCQDHSILNIKFVGYVTQKELPFYYKNSDIFVLPSTFGETWGLVANEAINYGLPIILSNRVGSSLDLVTPLNGFVFECGDIHRLAFYMDTLIRDNLLRNKMSTASFELSKFFTPSQTASGILQIINRLSSK